MDTKSADIENTGIAVSEETSIGGRPAVYMETAPAEGDSAENSSTERTANENTTGAKKIYMISRFHTKIICKCSLLRSSPFFFFRST